MMMIAPTGWRPSVPGSRLIQPGLSPATNGIAFLIQIRSCSETRCSMQTPVSIARNARYSFVSSSESWVLVS
jgi:hypothetical protein